MVGPSLGSLEYVFWLLCMSSWLRLRLRHLAWGCALQAGEGEGGVLFILAYVVLIKINT